MQKRFKNFTKETIDSGLERRHWDSRRRADVYSHWAHSWGIDWDSVDVLRHLKIMDMSVILQRRVTLFPKMSKTVNVYQFSFIRQDRWRHSWETQIDVNQWRRDQGWICRLMRREERCHRLKSDEDLRFRLSELRLQSVDPGTSGLSIGIDKDGIGRSPFLTWDYPSSKKKQKSIPHQE